MRRMSLVYKASTALLISCWCFLSICLTTPSLAAIASYNDNQHSSMLTLPLSVSVLIEDEDNAHSISTGKLSELLVDILPFYAPVDVDKGGVPDIVFELDYKVRSMSAEHVKAAFTVEYISLILQQKRDDKGTYIIAVESVVKYLELFCSKQTSPDLLPSLFNLPVLLILPSMKLPAHIIVPGSDVDMIGSSNNNTSFRKCTQSVIGMVAFMDLSANSCDASEHLSIDADSQWIRWNTPNKVNSFPMMFPITADTDKTWEGISSSDPLVTNNHLLARIAGIVTSAVQSLSVGSMKWKVGNSYSKIICPIITIYPSCCNNNTAAADINLPLIHQWMSSIQLPHQEIVLLSASHVLDEFPSLSVAIASAHRTYVKSLERENENNSPSEYIIPYINSAVLFNELSLVADSMIEPLLRRSGSHQYRILDSYKKVSTSDQNITGKLQSWWADKPPTVQAAITHNDKSDAGYQVAVVPIFIMSDIHRQQLLVSNKNVSGSFVQPLFNKNNRLVVGGADSNIVIGLHSTETDVHTYSDHNHLLSGHTYSAENLIAAGLTVALTGIEASHKLLSNTGTRIDLTWTHGNHPFHPFGSLVDQATATTASADNAGVVTSWKARRTLIASRMHAATYSAAMLLNTTLDKVLTLLHMNRSECGLKCHSFGSISTYIAEYIPNKTSADRITSSVEQIQQVLMDLTSSTDVLRAVVMKKGKQGSLLTITSALDRFESTVASYHREMHRHIEVIKQEVVSCMTVYSQVSPMNAAGAIRSGKSAHKLYRYIKGYGIPIALIIVLLLILVTLLLKKSIDKIEMRAKKAR